MIIRRGYILVTLIRIHSWSSASVRTMINWLLRIASIQCSSASITKTSCSSGFISFLDSACSGNSCLSTLASRTSTPSTPRPIKQWHQQLLRWLPSGSSPKQHTTYSTQWVTRSKVNWTNGWRLQTWPSFSFSAYSWRTACSITWIPSSMSLATSQYLSFSPCLYWIS